MIDGLFCPLLAQVYTCLDHDFLRYLLMLRTREAIVAKALELETLMSTWYT